MARIQKIDAQIRAGRYPNASTLARELEVSVRTVERDLEFMRDRLGAPLEYDPRRRGFYYTSPEFTLPTPPLGATDIAALNTAAELLRLVSGTIHESVVRDLIGRLSTSLPPGVSVRPAVGREVSFGLPAIRGDEALVVASLQVLHDALVTRRSVDLLYYSAYRDAWRRRRVVPYHLHYRDGAWYVLAWCHWRRSVRTFAVDRMRELTLTNHHFEVEPGFSAERYLESAWRIEAGDPVPVVVRFRPPASRYVRERKWHPTQAITEHPDGSLLLRVRVAGLPEIARWLLQFGGQAEVLEPLALRRFIAREAVALTALYSDLLHAITGREDPLGTLRPATT